jgi:S1-C subfamily serine protease
MQQKPRHSVDRQRPKASKPWQRVLRPIALLLFQLAEWLIEALESGLSFLLAKIRQMERKHKILLLMLVSWVIAGLLLNRISVQMRAGSEETDFVTAYQSIVQLGETALESSPPVLRSQSQYGISQTLYDRWRQSQGQPIQDITELSETEAKSLYRSFWQQGQCDSYAPPLDIACLDTLLSFDPVLSQTFFTVLPDNPQAAAIEVSRRRTAYHRRVLERLLPFSADVPQGGRLQQDRLTQIGGLQRDRALIEFAEARSGAVGSQSTNSPQSPDSPQSPVQDSSPEFTLVPSPTRSPAAAQPIELSAQQISAKADLFTVEVWIELEDGSHAPATGMIVSADGLILTNAHVVEGNSNPVIHSRNGQQYPGQAIAVDRRLDLALVQASGASNLTVAPFAETTAQVKPGDMVYAIGSPEGEHWKLTTTKVLAVKSPCGLPGLKCIRSPKGFLEPGNSGGPLLDQTGMVIGINRALQESTGEGVSIPAEVIQTFLERVKR